jgi:uncharacterized protein YbjT (DUF2867 family)
MRVAVVGATGKTGHIVAQRLLATGHEVRAVMRDPSRAQDLGSRGAEVFACDLGDAERTRAAFSAMEGVYYCSPLGIRHPDPLAIAAAREAGVNHFVFLSGLGAEKAPGVELLENKRALEQELATSGMPYTILNPNWFMDNLEFYHREEILAGTLNCPLSPTARIQPVAARDIAEVGVQALRTYPRNRAYIVSGPEPLTFPQITEMLGRALGRRIEYHYLTDDEFVTDYGQYLGEAYAQELLKLYHHYEEQNPVGDPEPLRQEFSIKLTSLQEYVRDLATRWKNS